MGGRRGTHERSMHEIPTRLISLFWGLGFFFSLSTLSPKTHVLPTLIIEVADQKHERISAAVHPTYPEVF